MIWLAMIASQLLLAQAPATSAEEFKGPEQAKRGYQLFFDESKAGHCGTCHALKGKGIPVGPDLTRLARLNPRAIVMAILASRTQYVVMLKPKTGKEFPAMKVEKEGATVDYYDLSATPPALRKFQKDEIADSKDNMVWKHPPESAGYNSDQLADVISYIRFVAYGDTKGVKPADIE